jgi:hypothetical protein
MYHFEAKWRPAFARQRALSTVPRLLGHCLTQLNTQNISLIVSTTVGNHAFELLHLPLDCYGCSYIDRTTDSNTDTINRAVLDRRWRSASRLGFVFPQCFDSRHGSKSWRCPTLLGHIRHIGQKSRRFTHWPASFCGSRFIAAHGRKSAPTNWERVGGREKENRRGKK